MTTDTELEQTYEQIDKDLAEDWDRINQASIDRYGVDFETRYEQVRQQQREAFRDKRPPYVPEQVEPEAGPVTIPDD